MASVKKFTESAVVNQLRHIERTIAHPENMDIDKDRTVQNYSLLPQRMSERDLILVSVGICVDGSKSNQSFPHEVNNPMDKTIDKKLCNVLILLFFSG